MRELASSVVLKLARADAVEDERPSPSFEKFAAGLREEARWLESFHSPDTTGQYASDCRTLRDLADRVEKIGWRLGYTGPPHAE